MSLKSLFLAFMGENRFVTTEQLYQAALEGELEVVEAPEGGWPRRKAKWVRLDSQSLSVFYLRTDREDLKRVESLDLHALAHRGGVLVTFIENEIVELMQNMIRINVANMHPKDAQRLWQILLKVRQDVSP